MRLITIAFGLVLFGFSLLGCASYEYSGKAISTIEYTTVDYFGEYTHVTIIDLENGEVLHREFFPTDEIIPDYEVIYTFDVTEVDSFLNQFDASGVFEMKDEYDTDEHIDDGGGWTLTINYQDGTFKTSTGDNFWPSDIFEKADVATVDLYGDDLFGTGRN
ncbi:MAG: hypothetical protein ACLFRI_03665 [Candidatus Izemoplasmataceae bacterium]